MQKWDIPPDRNHHESVPEEFRNISVSVKTAKYGSPIALGDVLRQRSIDEPFLLIVGFWRQRTSFEKWFEDIGWVKFTPAIWNSLWGSLSLRKIAEFDQAVKNLGNHYSVLRKQAKDWKTSVISTSGSRIVINPKIGSNKQRRIQCSLPFRIFWEAVGREATVHESPELFGIPFQNPVMSSARLFNQD